MVRLIARIGEPQTYRALYDTAYYKGFVAGSGGQGYNINVRAMIKRIQKKIPEGRSHLCGDRKRASRRLPVAGDQALTGRRWLAMQALLRRLVSPASTARG